MDSVSELADANSGSARFTYNGTRSITGIDRGVNGNTSGSIRILWNEEQWMVADSTANGIDHYVYDYTGERLMKASYTQSAAWQNDNALGPHGSLGEYKVYVNPYFVALNYDYEGQQTAWITQHYYMGAQRMASGWFARISMEESRPATGGGGLAVLDELEGFLKTFGLESGKDYTRNELEQPLSLTVVHPEYTSEETGPPSANMTTEGGLAEYCEGIISEVYLYHPNYLGNVDLVTNIDGEMHQFFLYTAWGENMHEHNAASSGFNSPFRFNAKELDQETGLAYYGARYYQNRYSLWLGVDQLAKKYPNATPYAFSGNNPVMLIDPNGMEWETAEDAKQGDAMMQEHRDKIVERKTKLETINTQLEDKTLSKSDRIALMRFRAETQDGIRDSEDAIKELEYMGSKDNKIKYHFLPSPRAGEKGITVYCENVDSDEISRIVINYTFGRKGQKAHEAKHAYDVSVNPNGWYTPQWSRGSKSTDVIQHAPSVDNSIQFGFERDAYRRGYFVSPSESPVTWEDLNKPEKIGPLSKNYHFGK